MPIIAGSGFGGANDNTVSGASGFNFGQDPQSAFIGFDPNDPSQFPTLPYGDNDQQEPSTQDAAYKLTADSSQSLLPVVTQLVNYVVAHSQDSDKQLNKVYKSLLKGASQTIGQSSNLLNAVGSDLHTYSLNQVVENQVALNGLTAQMLLGQSAGGQGDGPQQNQPGEPDTGNRPQETPLQSVPQKAQDMQSSQADQGYSKPKEEPKKPDTGDDCCDLTVLALRCICQQMQEYNAKPAECCTVKFVAEFQAGKLDVPEPNEDNPDKAHAAVGENPGFVPTDAEEEVVEEAEYNVG